MKNFWATVLLCAATIYGSVYVGWQLHELSYTMTWPTREKAYWEGYQHGETAGLREAKMMEGEDVDGRGN